MRQRTRLWSQTGKSGAEILLLSCVSYMLTLTSTLETSVFSLKVEIIPPVL